MKKLGLFLAILLVVPALYTEAQTMREKLGDATFDKATANYLVALKSGNDGLRRSAIYMLGQFEAADAEIPLMGVLRTSKDEKSRIAAAWALCKIGGVVGVYAVKQAVRFDKSLKVQAHSAWYYNLYVTPGTFAFIPAADGSTQIAERR